MSFIRIKEIHKLITNGVIQLWICWWIRKCRKGLWPGLICRTQAVGESSQIQLWEEVRARMKTKRTPCIIWTLSLRMKRPWTYFKKIHRMRPWCKIIKTLIFPKCKILSQLNLKEMWRNSSTFKCLKQREFLRLNKWHF